MLEKENLTILNKTRTKTPSVGFVSIKEKVLGKKYSLSLVFVGNSVSRKLNRIYRNKDKPTNILSFPLDKKSGEIFIDLSVARKEYKKFERDFDNFIAFLFIHGLLHLKGMEHGSKMDKAEEKVRKIFNI